MNNGKKKRSKNYYLQTNKRRKRNFVLEPGLKGFIATCNNREKECIREAYNLLNEFADKLWGAEVKYENVRNENVTEKDDEEDIDAALKKEVDALKSQKERRFQVVESGTNNCLFIRTQVEDPCHLMYTILDEIEKTKEQRTQYLLRLLPVLSTCKAYIDDIKKAVVELINCLGPGLKEQFKTFAINVRVRNNNGLKRDSLLSALVELLREKEFPLTADLKNPDVMINVEVLCTICCIGIVKDFYGYRKYNLIEFANKVKNAETNDEGKEKEMKANDNEPAIEKTVDIDKENEKDVCKTKEKTDANSDAAKEEFVETKDENENKSKEICVEKLDDKLVT